MAMITPYIYLKRQVIDMEDEEATPKLYLHLNEDLRDYLEDPVGVGNGQGTPDYSDKVVVNHNTVDVTTPGTYSIDLKFDLPHDAEEVDRNFTQGFDVIVLPSGTPKPPLGPHHGFYPKIVVDDWEAVTVPGGSGDDFYYRVLAEKGTDGDLIEARAAGTDGRGASGDIEASDTVKFDEVGEYDITYSLDEDEEEVDVKFVIYPNGDPVEPSQLGIKIPGEVLQDDGSYHVQYTAGTPIPVPVGTVDDGSPLVDGITVHAFMGPTDISDDGFRYAIYGLVDNIGNTIYPTVKEYVFIMSKPDDVPVILSEGSVVKDDVRHIAVDVGGEIPNIFGYDDDGNLVDMDDIRFNPELDTLDLNTPGSYPVVAAIHSGSNYSEDLLINVGIDAVLENMGCGDGGGSTFDPCKDGQPDTIPDNVDYF